jgi:predicted RND superfamily exporter protein
VLSQLSAYSSRMAYLFPIALLVIGLVHYDAFRTFQGLFLPLLTALLAVLWSLGLMGLLGVPLDPLNTTTAVLILAVAAGHAVQVLKRFYEDYQRIPNVEGAVVSCLQHVGPVMLGAGAVATLSFWSLASFGTASIRTFGLFTGLGIASALVIEMTLIPALRVLLPAPRRREREREAAAHPLIDRLLIGAFAAADRGRYWVGIATVLIVLACVAGAMRLRVDTSLKREFKTTDQVRVDDRILNEHFAGTSTLLVLVQGPDDESLEDPAIITAIDGLQRELSKDPAVGKAYSYVDVLRQTHASFTADDPTAGRLPMSEELVAQYLLLQSGSESGLDAILDPTHRTAKVRILVHDDSTRHGEALIARASQYVGEHFPKGYTARFTGTLASNAATTEVMVDGKLRNIAQISAVSVIVASVLLRSFLGGVLVALPLGLTVLVNFGVMGWLGLPLDMVTAAISAMAVGIGADYAMYLVFRIREEAASGDGLEGAVKRALGTSGKAVVFVSSAVAAGYATLCLSGFGVHVLLGSLVALAMLVSAAGALILLPAVVLALRPRFIAAPAARAGEGTGVPTLPLEPVGSPARAVLAGQKSEGERQLA